MSQLGFDFSGERGVARNMSILKRGAQDTYTSVRVLALVCDCLSTEALRVAIC